MKILELKAAVAAFEIKRLTQPFTVEAMSESDGTFSGKGMVFDSVHSTSSWQLGPEWKDRVRPGAFAETLAAHEAEGTKPLMLYMHERGNIPGVWTSIVEKKGHLQLSGQVSKRAITPSGVPLVELMKMGAITGLSIGFKPTKVSLDESKKLRDIHSVELGEISIVDIPGSGSARITDVKRDIRGLEEGLRTLGLSKREAKALLAEGFGAISETKGVQSDPWAASTKAHDATKAAEKATDKAEESGSKEDHDAARAAHKVAFDAHDDAIDAHQNAAAEMYDDGNVEGADEHDAAASKHADSADSHRVAMKDHREARKENEGDKSKGGDGKNPDDIARDDHGRFANKSAEEIAEVLAVMRHVESSLNESRQTRVDKAAKASVAAKSSSAAAHAATAATKTGGLHQDAMAKHEAAAADNAAAMVANRMAANSAEAEGDKAAAAKLRDVASDHQGQFSKHKVTARDHMNQRSKDAKGGGNPDDIARDDHGRFATKSALDVAAELKSIMNESGETPAQQARRDAAARSTLESIRDLANIFKE